MAHMTGSNQYQTRPQPPVPVPATNLLAQAAGTSKSGDDDHPGHPLYGVPQEALAADISPIDDIRASAHYRSVVARNVLGQLLRELDTIFT